MFPGNQSYPAAKEPWGPESTPGQLFARSNTHSKQAHVPDPHIFTQVGLGDLHTHRGLHDFIKIHKASFEAGEKK